MVIMKPKCRGKGVLAKKKARHAEVNEMKKLDISYGVYQGKKERRK